MSLLAWIAFAVFLVIVLLIIAGKLKELVEHAQTHMEQNDRIIELLKQQASRSKDDRDE